MTFCVFEQGNRDPCLMKCVNLSAKLSEQNRVNMFTGYESWLKYVQ